MRKPKVQQRTERRISAALRLVMVAVLLLAQIALVIVLSDLLKQRMALAYTVLQLLAGVVAMRIWSRPGATSYKMGWIILVLFVPVVGLIRDIESAIGTEVRGYTLTIRYICPKCRAKNAQ